jgi:hypothetical protein
MGRHCEERSDEAIHKDSLDCCDALRLAMTGARVLDNTLISFATHSITQTEDQSNLIA